MRSWACRQSPCSSHCPRTWILLAAVCTQSRRQDPASSESRTSSHSPNFCFRPSSAFWTCRIFTSGTISLCWLMLRAYWWLKQIPNISAMRKAAAIALLVWREAAAGCQAWETSVSASSCKKGMGRLCLDGSHNCIDPAHVFCRTPARRSSYSLYSLFGGWWLPDAADCTRKQAAAPCPISCRIESCSAAFLTFRISTGWTLCQSPWIWQHCACFSTAPESTFHQGCICRTVLTTIALSSYYILASPFLRESPFFSFRQHE